MNESLKISEVMPSLEVIAKQWNLKLNRLRDYKIAVKILKNSILKN